MRKKSFDGGAIKGFRVGHINAAYSIISILISYMKMSRDAYLGRLLSAAAYIVVIAPTRFPSRSKMPLFLRGRTDPLAYEIFN